MSRVCAFSATPDPLNKPSNDSGTGERDARRYERTSKAAAFYTDDSAIRQEIQRLLTHVPAEKYKCVKECLDEIIAGHDPAEVSRSGERVRMLEKANTQLEGYLRDMQGAAECYCNGESSILLFLETVTGTLNAYTAESK